MHFMGSNIYFLKSLVMEEMVRIQTHDRDKRNVMPLNV